jgi:hypothetical protein
MILFWFNILCCSEIKGGISGSFPGSLSVDTVVQELCCCFCICSALVGVAGCYTCRRAWREAMGGLLWCSSFPSDVAPQQIVCVGRLLMRTAEVQFQSCMLILTEPLAYEKYKKNQLVIFTCLSRSRMREEHLMGRPWQSVCRVFPLRR